MWDSWFGRLQTVNQKSALGIKQYFAWALNSGVMVDFFKMCRWRLWHVSYHCNSDNLLICTYRVTSRGRSLVLSQVHLSKDVMRQMQKEKWNYSCQKENLIAMTVEICSYTKMSKNTQSEYFMHMTVASSIQATLTLELGQCVSQHPQLFDLLLDVLLRHQAVVDGRVPLKLLHRLLQVTAEQTQAASAQIIRLNVAHLKFIFLTNTCAVLMHVCIVFPTHCSCWMTSSSWLRYFSRSSSTRRRCLWSGSSCVRMASSIMRLSSDSVCRSSERTESWFSSCGQRVTWSGVTSRSNISTKEKIPVPSMFVARPPACCVAATAVCARRWYSAAAPVGGAASADETPTQAGWPPRAVAASGPKVPTESELRDKKQEVNSVWLKGNTTGAVLKSWRTTPQVRSPGARIKVRTVL